MVFVSQFTKTRLVEIRTIIDPLGYVLPLLLAPVLTMRLLAEEKRSGTFEMLMTAPVGDAEVVLSKFAGVWIFYSANVALTGLHVLTMLLYYDGGVNWGSFFTGYLGMLLIAGLFLSFGLFLSSLFENPMLAALISFVAGLSLLMIGPLLASPLFLQGSMAFEITQFMLPFQHYRNFMRGLVDTRDLAYFIIMIAFFLFLTTKVVESRKWR